MKLKKTHVVEYITLINLQFPNSYKFSTMHEQELFIELWYEGLKNYPKEICDIAVRNTIYAAEFSPKIGTILREIEKIRQAAEPTDLDLWQHITNSFHRVRDIVGYIKYANTCELTVKKLENIFNSLPELVKVYLKSSSALVELALLSDEDLHYEKARFLKYMPLVRDRFKYAEQAKVFLELCGNIEIKAIEGDSGENEMGKNK